MPDLPENIADLPEIPVPCATKASSSAKKVRGRPITKENSKQFQISSARAKKARKEARAQMLLALTTKLDLGTELVKAWKSSDGKQMDLIEKALRIVGLHHDQSPDAQAQKVQVSAKTDAKVDAKLAVPSLNISFVDAKKPEENKEA